MVHDNNLGITQLKPGQRVVISGNNAYPVGPVVTENLIDVAGDLVVDFADEYIGDDENGCTQYRWYRLYKSGWVEQGGRYFGGSTENPAWATVQLPVKMADSNYCVFKTVRTARQRDATLLDVSVYNLTTSSIDIYCPSEDVSWTVYGQSASE